MPCFIMIRFVDIKDQGTGYRFAFWCTTSDRFVLICDQMAFDNLDDLKDAMEAACVSQDIKDRFLRLCPEWTHTGEDNIEAFYE